MVGRGHDHLAAKGLNSLTDAVVVGGYPCLGQHLGHLTVDPLNNGLATQHGQGFARKTRRGVTGGDDCNEFHFF